ncbi:PREDICTED: protein croquemort-like [Dufourea novaeangliae]|uniref:Protein croquemort n=1 Tax=Dufourea novaeangliae TaxID=178035 RepID=A0A154PEP9_DUFNO|nr:PREDICTED: protein croquemort-like [Dufourea novaeangliae]KZC09768.1 Protein croquemort [Dufourea novaeangliae]
MIQASKSTIIILIIGLLIAIFGLTVGILWSLIYSTIIQSQLALTPTSSNYELWKETPIPMYLKFYMFNLTNPEAFTSPDGTKPHFEEMGPYVFREIDYKVQQDWNENNTITYQRKRVWHFDESLSAGSLSDNVTNINPVTASIAYMLRFKDNFLRDIADRIMRIIGQKLVITKSVNEFLFEGYNDTMLKVAQKLNLTRMPMTKFAWFFGRNDSASYDGTFNMHTGVTDMRELGIVKEWNYNNHVSYYPGECGTVRGTNGDLWPPLPDNETVSFFVSDICTSLTAKYSNTTEHEGLSGVTFTINEATLDNGTKVPSRKCYYEEESIPSGALNISSCKWGAPAFISFPHFYLGDPSYSANIIGMKPQKNKHELSISLEPKTGVPLKVNAKLQLNLLIDRDEKIKMFKNLTKTFVPMLWFTQEATLTSDYAGTVKFIIILESLGSVTFFGIGAIGIIVMFVGIFVLVRNNFRGEENQVLLTRSMNGDSGIIDG